jgi:uncharacterized protein DUF6627
MITTLRRIIASLLIVSIGGLALPLPTQAGIIATDSIAAVGERSRIASLLDRAEVRAQLQAYGVNPADVKARVAALTDAEAAQLAAKIDTLPAGGADILGVILIVFLVLLITDILGFTKVFPFTRSIK